LKKKLDKKQRHIKRVYVTNNVEKCDLETLEKFQPSKFKIKSVEFHTGTDEDVVIDMTFAFLKIWAEFGFKTFTLPNLSYSLAYTHVNLGNYNFNGYQTEDWFVVITYSYQIGDSWKIIFDKNTPFEYPPYKRRDSRIPKYRALPKDVLNADLISLSVIFTTKSNSSSSSSFGEQIEESSPINEAEDISQEGEIEENIDEYQIPTPSFEVVDVTSVTDEICECRGPGALFYADTPFHNQKQLAAKWIKRSYQSPIGTYKILKISWTDRSEDVF
jgi:hypothetical protein